jgi:multidrug resistance efflux pump
LRAALPDVAQDSADGGFTHHDDALFRALTEHAHSALIEVDIPHIDTDDFADAQASSVEQLEHGAIAKLVGFLTVDSTDKHIDLTLSEKTRQTALSPGTSDSEHRLDLEDAFVAQIAVEGANSADLALNAGRGIAIGQKAGEIFPDEELIDGGNADIAAVEADAERARAMLEEARANRQDLQVIAPFAGTVATRTAEPGEVVIAGTPIVMLVNLSEVYLRAFVPEGEIGKVRVGQAARVYLGLQLPAVRGSRKRIAAPLSPQPPSGTSTELASGAGVLGRQVWTAATWSSSAGRSSSRITAPRTGSGPRGSRRSRATCRRR